MSTLISSAVGGRKAVPKAPPRRRAAPSANSAPPPPPTPNNQIEEARDASSKDAETTGLAPGSGGSPISAAAPRLPSPAAVVERPVNLQQHISAVVEQPNPQLEAPDPPHEQADDQVVAPREASLTAHGETAPAAPIKSTAASHPATSTSSTAQEHTGARIRKRARDEDSATVDSSSRKAPRRTDAESRANAVEEVQSEQTEISASNAQPRRAGRTRGARNVQTEDDDTLAQRDSGPTRSRRQLRSRPARRTSDQDSQPAPTTDSQAAEGDQGDRIPTRTTVGRRRKTTRGSNVAIRAEAEVQAEDGLAADGDEDSDPEKHLIDPSTLSMYDLSHDTRHGRTSERERKMAQIDWAAVARKRREEADAIMRGESGKNAEADVVQSTEGADGTANPRHDDDDGETNDEEGAGGGASPEEPETRANRGGVRFKMVGGQIVEDETSLTIDRAARVAEAAAQAANEPVEEENDLTVRFNRTTYINARRRDETERLPMWRARSDAWGDEETDRFYDALRMFGTDFFIISKMFHPKTRRQIKAKFVREERLDAERINAALLGKDTNQFNLDHYAQAINRDVSDFHKYDSLEHANEVIKASMKDKEEAMRAAVKEDEENNRQREVQRQQREKQREAAEKRKEEKSRMRSNKKRGDVWGAGTFGAADDGEDEA